MQRPFTTRSVIACALALSAAIPSSSQTTQDSAAALEHRSTGQTTTAEESAGGKLPLDPSNAKARFDARLRVRLIDRESPRTRTGRRTAERSLGNAEPLPVASADSAMLTRDFEALRARLAPILDARFTQILVDAVGASVAPLTVDRGQLMRASLAGNLRASYWLLRHPELLLGPEAAVAYRAAAFTPGAQEHALRVALYQRLVVQAGKVEVLEAFDVLGHVLDDFASHWLDAESTMRTLFELELGFAGSPLAREARLARALLLVEHGRGVVFLEALAARLFTSLLGDPDSDIASAAEDALWRLLNLRVGCHAPTLCGNDKVGNELCLQNFHGRIVLVRFWSLHDACSDDVLQQDAYLEQHFWDHPFSVLGINRDGDRQLYLQRDEQYGLPGDQVYEGPQPENLLPEIQERRAGRPLAFDAWREARSGSSYLIDARGVIRAVDPPLSRLPELIQGLVDESYLEKRLLGH
jgi:hypothetical protein